MSIDITRARWPFRPVVKPEPRPASPAQLRYQAGQAMRARMRVMHPMKAGAYRHPSPGETGLSESEIQRGRDIGVIEA